MRPRQWIKNVLVIAAPAAAGLLLDPAVLVPSLIAFVSFCAVSSAVYLVNDIADREVDRLHPVKATRPIASGALGVRPAAVLAVVLAVTALAVALLGGVELTLLIAGYLAMQVAYNVRLKHEPVIDLAVVSLGFLLRAVAGGVAADIEVSRWFLMVAGFGSLFVVSAKRYSELATLGAASGTRRSLLRYSESYLRFVWSMAAAATLLAYSLWAFETGSDEAGANWKAISVVPFALGLLRYSVDVDNAAAADPEDLVFGDRVLHLVGLVWLGTLALGVLSG